ncbi:MAG TPA: hypothetical protein VHN18_00560, partial [Micromonosporaceae bacterium]|nr:hypothetical protein [Micromonosporaceae bacterium]
AVVRVCRLVEGMPLALELAAGWTKILPTDEIASEIQRSLDFLSTSLRNVPQRHRSITAVFEQTWGRLTDEERRVFNALSVFRGGYHREAAEVVAGVSIRVLSNLMDKSLLTREPNGRYQMHELMRQYAQDRLETSPEEAIRIHELHATYYTRFLHEWEQDLNGGRQREACLEIEADIDNIRAAWSWAVEHSKVEAIESAGSGISASATVPAASRMSPPSDPAARSMPAAQPTVYGRSVDDHVEPVRHDRTADAAGGDEPLWPRTPADTGDRFPSGAEAAESRLRGGTEDRFQRDAGPWPPAGAEPWSSDDRPDVRSAADRSSERPGRAAAFAQVPVPPIQAPHADQPREPGGRFARTDGPAPDAFGAIGPVTGTARPVSPARGVAQPARVDDLRPSDEGGNRAPVAPWDDQPQRQRWAGGAGNPDQTLSGAWDGLDTGDARADAWPGTRAEAPPTGRATAAGTAPVGGRDTEDGPPRQQSGAATGADSAPPWVDRDDGQQERFDSFRSEMERPADPPPPQVRNARVLAMVLAAAVLLLAVPLGTLWLLGRTGDQGFNPAVGSCVKQDGAGAVAAGCGDAGAYTVVAKANDPGKCDPKQPHVVLQNVEGDNVLCLRPAAAK